MHGNGSRLSAADQTRLAGSHSYAPVMLGARVHTRAYFTKSTQSESPTTRDITPDHQSITPDQPITRRHCDLATQITPMRHAASL